MEAKAPPRLPTQMAFRIWEQTEKPIRGARGIGYGEKNPEHATLQKFFFLIFRNLDAIVVLLIVAFTPSLWLNIIIKH